ncbi:unnamed protein product [Protopolystoma xenopodis]|uniref:Uncharacterized protein n=1 Tax=Protopolystoma xenopodis TaxID=117903 RepID=A0A3S5B7V1_9PLAT|nr:unnamed protein product [Protopolystoma xenopodis]
MVTRSLGCSSGAKVRVQSKHTKGQRSRRDAPPGMGAGQIYLLTKVMASPGMWKTRITVQGRNFCQLAGLPKKKFDLAQSLNLPITATFALNVAQYMLFRNIARKPDFESGQGHYLLGIRKDYEIPYLSNLHLTGSFGNPLMKRSVSRTNGRAGPRGLPLCSLTSQRDEEEDKLVDDRHKEDRSPLDELDPNHTSPHLPNIHGLFDYLFINRDHH